MFIQTLLEKWKQNQKQSQKRYQRWNFSKIGLKKDLKQPQNSLKTATVISPIILTSCDQLSGKPVGNQIATSLFVRMDQLSNYSMAQNIHSILGSHNQKIVAEITQLAHPCKCHSNPELEQEAYPTRGKQKVSVRKGMDTRKAASLTNTLKRRTWA
jgi:hypothetical protein